jgi:serpin B
MLELGARGSTASQIATALDTPTLTGSSQAALWRALSAQEAHAASRSGIDFDAANRLWLQRGFPLNVDFNSALNEQFGASLGRVDFRSDSDGAAKAINSWGRTHTDGKITQLLSPLDVQAAQLVLANAEYFKGDWEYPFELSLTAKMDFHPTVGAPERVPFMTTSDPLFVPATSDKA